MPETIQSAQILVPKFVQTTSQCFYFFDGAPIGKLDIGDVFISFCNLTDDGKPVVAGARKYKGGRRGRYIDVPAMGVDILQSGSEGYCEPNDLVKIRIIKQAGRYIDLNKIFNIPPWYDNTLHMINMDGGNQ